MSRVSRVLAVAVVFAGLTAAPSRAAEVDNLLPAQTESIVFVNVRQILDSDLIKKYALGQIKQALKGADAQKILEKLGLDPLKDVDRVTAGTWGKDKDDMNVVLVVRGKFDAAKLFEAAKDEAKKENAKISIVEEGNYKLVKIVDENGDSKKPMYAAVANEKTLIGGTDKKLVVAAVEASIKGGKPELKKDLAALLLNMDEKASMFACGLVEGKVSELPDGLDKIPGIDPKELAKQLANMKTVAITFKLTSDVSLDVTMGMKNGDSADEFGKTLDNLINTAKTFLPFVAGQKENLKPLVDEVGKTLKSKVKGSEVSVVLKLSADAIGKASGSDD